MSTNNSFNRAIKSFNNKFKKYGFYAEEKQTSLRTGMVEYYYTVKSILPKDTVFTFITDTKLTTEEVRERQKLNNEWYLTVFLPMVEEKRREAEERDNQPELTLKDKYLNN